MTSPSEANLLVHYEDFELAQSVKRELMQLRSRPTMPTSEDIMLVGRKAALTGSSSRAGRAAVDNIRAEASLAICKLAAAIDGNARLMEENQPDARVNTSLLWARAIDLGQAWMRVAEQPRRELADLTTSSHDSEAGAAQALALAATPAPIPRIDDASAISNIRPDHGGTEIVKALEAAPIGSAITFANDNPGLLCLAGSSIVRGTEAYRRVEHFGQACNCSFNLHETAGTITFYRR
jgi:hypothetical protein